MAEKRKGIPRRSAGTAQRSLRKRSSRGSLPEKLPLVHVTSVWAATEIIKSGRFQITQCKVFNRKLIYFFVLRPAYRTKDGESKTHHINYFPVVFVVSPDAIPNPFHVYPFDTGGAIAGAFDDQADLHIPLEDYELEPKHEAAVGHIGWAFKTLTSYYEGDISAEILEGIPEFETVTRGYFDIARMGRAGSNQHDKRASAVEMAASHDIVLKGNAKLAIIPKQYLESDAGPNTDFIKLLNEQDIEYRLYDWQPNTRPNDFQDEIARITHEWLKEKAVL